MSIEDQTGAVTAGGSATTDPSGLIFKPITRVLVANRGEIAVRIIRGCHDNGIEAVAVYAESDRDALHVRMADDAFALGGSTPQETYLSIAKLIDAGRKGDADAVHPGYGFLAESELFAQAVLDAGLVWIGPPPAAIAALGAKTVAREMAVKVGAPLAPGLPAVSKAAEIEAFAAEHGLPVIIKAVYGGGGRGMRVIREAAEIRDAFDSAVSEATTAFGRGDVFVERFLDRARHLETQCVADRNGNVVVISTRDCSVQRRNQKLIEEAPAPFLTEEQIARVYTASKAILKEARYVNAGTCEFLLAPDGLISFNEVNTRLQVEHPVSEIVTGFDLVSEQLKIAAGGLIDYPDPAINGHAIEFRINGEDPGRGFLPSPGTLSIWRPPSGPGVRWDGGFEQGDTLPGEFDSLLGKLIISGADRAQTLARARRALAEFATGGVATVLPFDRAIADDPAFTASPFSVHTRWIETEWDNTIEPFTPPAPGGGAGGAGSAREPGERQRLVVEVDGRRLEVTLPAELASAAPGAGRTAFARVPHHAGAARRQQRRTAAAQDGAVISPMQARVIKVAVVNGQQVAAGEVLMVVEAMKMEQSLTAQKPGQIADLTLRPDDSVQAGQTVCRIVEV